MYISNLSAKQQLSLPFYTLAGIPTMGIPSVTNNLDVSKICWRCSRFYITNRLIWKKYPMKIYGKCTRPVVLLFPEPKIRTARNPLCSSRRCQQRLLQAPCIGRWKTPSVVKLGDESPPPQKNEWKAGIWKWSPKEREMPKLETISLIHFDGLS